MKRVAGLIEMLWAGGCATTSERLHLPALETVPHVELARYLGTRPKTKEAHGQAHIVDRVTNAKLEVSFFRPFGGPDWIVDLAPDYSYAVVGHPGRDHLWIVSRSPTMSDDTYQRILARPRAQRYEAARLVRTVQAS